MHRQIVLKIDSGHVESIPPAKVNICLVQVLLLFVCTVCIGVMRY